MKASIDSGRGESIDRNMIGGNSGGRTSVEEAEIGSAQMKLANETQGTASVSTREKHDNNGICDRANHPLSVHTLLVCLAFGLAGVLPDVDHMFEGLHRSFHIPFTLLGWCLLCLAISLDVRYVHSHRVNDPKTTEN